MSDNKNDLRAPIATVVGHIDHGKTSLLDKIRGTAVQKREAGGITQHIGASYFPMDTIREICGDLLNKLKVEFNLPGLLVIDTPGHESFINLRARGTSVADIALLVVDVVEGLMPQSYESLNLLRARKCPFILAANKIDRITGWKSIENSNFLDSFKKQNEFVQKALDEKIYEIIGELSKEKFNAERYDRIKDFTKNVAIVPTSAKTGEGIADLLMMLTGLAQQYLQKRLHVSMGPAKGSVLEVKEEPGLGMTIDTIIYEGRIRRGDNIVIGGIGEPIITKVRALLVPKPLDEIRDPREKFSSVDEVRAAAGIKIGAPNLEKAIAGAAVYVFTDEEHLNSLITEIKKEIGEIVISSTDIAGIILKADALGSLEAIIKHLRENKTPIRVADIGDISKRDVIEASVSLEQDPLNGIILGFDVGIKPDAREEADRLGVPILTDNIIYKLLENFDEWKLGKEKELREDREKAIIRPGKIKVLPGYVFRISKPAVVGVEVLGGQICSKYQLVRSDGRKVGEIVAIQDKGENIPKATKGEEVAISIKDATVGRTFKEGDELWVDMSETMFATLRSKFWEELPESQKEILDELREIKRKEKPLWGF